MERLTNPNTPLIKEFSIYNLFGDRNFIIKFKSSTNILIGENGTGKTTVLNILYALLSCKFNKLLSFDFDKLSIKFNSGSHVEFKKSQLIKDSQRNIEHHLPSHRLSRLSPIEFDELQKLIIKYPGTQVTRYPIFVRIANKLGVPSRVLYEMLRRPESDNVLIFQEQAKVIRDNLPNEVLYFPTYRRIEEELKNLGYSGEDIDIVEDDKLIQFGMEDVKKRFYRITSDIKNSSIEWFSKINGQMLSQLVDGIIVDNEMRESIGSPEALRIVLDRIGENIAGNNKEHIFELIKSKEIMTDSKYHPLIYFLSNLIKVYDQQRENDNAIKTFTTVCNDYLVDKSVIYNESKVTIDVIRKKTGNPVAIEKLSSGKKQIISLFSKLYLDTSIADIILFDEPELSLSIEWQKQLLPHILASNKCNFMLVATHSPFIFENELDNCASGIDLYLKEI